MICINAAGFASGSSSRNCFVILFEFSICRTDGKLSADIVLSKSYARFFFNFLHFFVLDRIAPPSELQCKSYQGPESQCQMFGRKRRLKV